MITEEKINEIITKIAENIEPEKIILFGSYAYGTPTNDSDIDLCIVVNADKKITNDLSVKIRKFLRGILVPMDIIIYTSQEIEEWKNVKMAFPTIITRKGKVLYDKS